MDTLLPNGSSSQTNLVTLVRQAQDGSELAAQVVFVRCQEPLLAVIRQVIRPPLRRLYDSDDFLNETFIEIFTTNFADTVLRSPETLWPYLKKIAENKVRDANRKYLFSQRYNIIRDVSLESLGGEECLGAKGLSPDDVFMLKELVEERLTHLVDQLPPMLQQIIRLLLQGAPAVDIANRLEVEPRRVYRAMEWLKKKIREE